MTERGVVWAVLLLLLGLSSVGAFAGSPPEAIMGAFDNQTGNPYCYEGSYTIIEGELENGYPKYEHSGCDGVMVLSVLAEGAVLTWQGRWTHVGSTFMWGPNAGDSPAGEWCLCTGPNRGEGAWVGYAMMVAWWDEELFWVHDAPGHDEWEHWPIGHTGDGATAWPNGIRTWVPPQPWGDEMRAEGYFQYIAWPEDPDNPDDTPEPDPDPEPDAEPPEPDEDTPEPDEPDPEPTPEAEPDPDPFPEPPDPSDPEDLSGVEVLLRQIRDEVRRSEAENTEWAVNAIDRLRDRLEVAREQGVGATDDVRREIQDSAEWIVAATDRQTARTTSLLSQIADATDAMASGEASGGNDEIVEALVGGSELNGSYTGSALTFEDGDYSGVQSSGEDALADASDALGFVDDWIGGLGSLSLPTTLGTLTSIEVNFGECPVPVPSSWPTSITFDLELFNYELFRMLELWAGIGVGVIFVCLKVYKGAW